MIQNQEQLWTLSIEALAQKMLIISKVHLKMEQVMDTEELAQVDRVKP